MTQMRRRVESLETRLLPSPPVTVHIVGRMQGQSEADACAEYGQPIAEGDEIIWLVPGVRDEAA